jgi:hypothetical protein
MQALGQLVKYHNGVDGRGLRLPVLRGNTAPANPPAGSMVRVLPPRKLIYQRKSAKVAQLTVLTWRDSISLWGSENFSVGTAAKVSATLLQWVRHLDNTGQQFTLLQQDYRRQTLPTWPQILHDANLKSWHA